jgi:FixJ family two-component response regulator
VNEASPVVFVVDDDPAVREALTSLIRSVGLRVCAFGSALEFLSADPPDAPCCLVLDVRLPGLSGLDLQRELLETDGTIPIIFITGHADVPMSVRAMKAGAVEFLAKPFREEELLDAIRVALPRSATARAHRARVQQIRARASLLTPREREVARQLLKGLLNKQVAAALGISEITVKIHRRHIMEKMGASSLVELCRMMEKLSGEEDSNASGSRQRP